VSKIFYILRRVSHRVIGRYMLAHENGKRERPSAQRIMRMSGCNKIASYNNILLLLLLLLNSIYKIVLKYLI